MNSLWLVITALAAFLVAYRFYGAFLAAKVAVLNDANPLLAYLHKPVMKKMVGWIEGGRRLSYDAYRFIWVVLFTSIWLDQQD